jgi:hypothetical protein
MIDNSDLDCRKANNCMTPYCSCDLLHTRAPQAGSKLDLIKARIKGNGKTVELQSLSTDSVTNENKIKDALMLSAAWGGDLLISSENRARFKRIADVLCPD